MPWSTPGTVEPGQVYTAARYNTDTVGNLLSLVEAGTALPTSPADQQSFYYIADGTNGVVWHLRYRSAATGSYKWEFVGGGEMYSNILTSQALGATALAYVDLATVGPSITVPLAGDYLIKWGGRFICGGILSIGAMGIKLGSAAAPADGNNGTRWVAASIPGANNHGSVNSQDVATALAASAVVKAMYFQNNANQITFGNRYMSITPIRVG